MNPEHELPAIEDASVAASRVDVVATPAAELKTMELSDLQQLEQMIVSELRQQGMKARTFAEISTHLEPRLLKRLKTPDLLREQIFSNIISLQREVTLQAKQATEQKRETFMTSLGQRGQERIAEWDQERQTTQPLSAKDQQLVDLVHQTEVAHQQQGDNFHRMTNALEAIVASYLERVPALGQRVTISPTSRWDDISRKADFVVWLDVGHDQRVALGIDFTVTHDDAVQDKKISFNLDRPWREIKYATVGDAHRPGVPAKQTFIPAVIAVDLERAQAMADDLDYIESAEKTFPDKADERVHEYEQDPLLMFVLPLTLVEQLKIQRQELEKVVSLPAPEKARARVTYDETIEYLSSVLDHRQAMKSQAVQTTTSGRQAATYHLAQPEFLAAIQQQHAQGKSSAVGVETYQF